MTTLSIHKIKQMYRHGSLPRHWWQGWLCFVLNCPSSWLISHEEYILKPNEQAKFVAGMAKMAQGVPLAYLTGDQEFFGRSFWVDESTLIPRADTERLVEVVLEWIGNQTFCKAGNLLDLGTGTGCIAITLAKALPTWQVLACDVSMAALKVAQNNAHRLEANNCRFVHSDWFDDVSGSFNVIVSNPPYIAKDDEHLARLTHEPMTALVSDNAGMADIAHIVTKAREFLTCGGLLAIEHGYDQALATRQLFLDSGYHDVAVVCDYGGNDRLTIGVWRG
ncbi:peptide chain release factor N(5)-glutamine methyltransferase [Moraxella sp. ZY200743]|uniref:peptide chain release factor N(5)-glutamine methyltransferase n=1 Tax=Moraxella sp. ZY200743 TaxID=2911970 RepID=UPI003D7CD586